MRVSILDDYQGVALDMADWSPLRDRGIEIVVERFPFVDEDAAARELFDRVGVWRAEAVLFRGEERLVCLDLPRAERC